MKKNKIIKSIRKQVYQQAEQNILRNFMLMDDCIAFTRNEYYDNNDIYIMYDFNFKNLSKFDSPYLIANYNIIVKSEYNRLAKFSKYIDTGEDGIDNMPTENIAF